MRHLPALVLLVVLAVSGCVEPVPGLPLAGPPLDGVDYVVSAVRPASAPGATAVAGALDAVEGSGRLIVSGWAPAPAGELLVVADPPLRLVSQRRVRRPDAAQALGVSEDRLGFRLVVESSGPVVPPLCVLFRAAGAVEHVRLAGSDAASCGTGDS